MTMVSRPAPSAKPATSRTPDCVRAQQRGINALLATNLDNTPCTITAEVPVIVAKPVSINVSHATAATRVFVFHTWDISGAAAADPTSGDFVHIWFKMRNTSTARKGV